MVVVGAFALLGCRSSSKVCDHYMHKSYQPKSKGGLGPPKKAVKACAAVCRDKKNIDACRTAAGWYDMLGDTENMVKINDVACGYGYKIACGARKRLERRKATAAYNKQASALRRTRGKCMTDPAPCERDCKAGDVNACMQLADRARIGFKGHGKKPAKARAYYERVCKLHDTKHYCWSPFIVPSALCAVPDNRKPCDEELEGACPPAPKPLKGCGTISQHGKITDVAKHLAVCNGQRACDTIVRETCLANIDACKAACDQHNDGARCRQIGLMYKQGIGLPTNPKLATKYIEKSCTLGSRWPCKKLNRSGHYLKPRPLPKPDAGVAPAKGSK